MAGKFAVGTKFNAGKVRLSLLHPAGLESTARALMYGAKKYEAWNWLMGMSYTDLADAAQRHAYKWLMGKPCDKESGLSHLDHYGACVHFLQVYEALGYYQFDDRPHRILTGRYESVPEQQNTLSKIATFEPGALVTFNEPPRPPSTKE